MKHTSKKFNPNWIAVGLLLGGFLFSAIRFYMVTKDSTDEPDGGATTKQVIRIAHWQLEPGFRESMQWAMDQYNTLPHVKEAGIEVAQLALPTQVYNQFIYVHMISGTAPDIAVKRDTATIKGNALSKFFTPLGNYVDKPNPYNAPQYQAEGLPHELSVFLQNTPWKETYFDNLQSAYDPALSDYYTIPISSWGGYRVFYNLDLLHRVKAFVLQNASPSHDAPWLEDIWRTENNDLGFIPKESGTNWLKSDDVPQTLGQFILYCRAIQAYSKANSIQHLVPISASNYGPDQIGSIYSAQFLSQDWESISLDLGKDPSSIEFLAGFERGVWDFNSPGYREYFKLLRIFTDFYPQGFLGLDREQARRRFVLGQAGIYFAGGWDASSIFQGVENRDNPNDRFEIKVAPSPIAAPGERWDNIINSRVTEANAEGGVPFAINKRSPNFDWSVDFLQFLSSHRINEQFNQRAGWLPVIVGAQPPEEMKPFIPMVQGFPSSIILNIARGDIPASIRNAYFSTLKLFLSGDIEAEELQAHMTEVLNNPNIGIRKAWIKAMQDSIDRTRADDRTLSVERLSQALGSETAGQRERALFYNLLTDGAGIKIERHWNELHPNEPYPSY